MAQKTAEKATAKTPAPDPTFKYRRKIGEDEKTYELFMSFALLNRLTRACPDEQEASRIAFNGELQDKLLAILLAPENEEGLSFPEDFTMEKDTKGINPDVIQDMLMWAVSHITHFFTGLVSKNLVHIQATKETSDQMASQAEVLTASLTGSKS